MNIYNYILYIFKYIYIYIYIDLDFATALYSPFRDSQVATVPPSNAVTVVDGIEACSKLTIAILQADCLWKTRTGHLYSLSSGKWV